jgi:hypothetical protein
MDLAPIALFAYKRPGHMRQTVEALLENELASQSDLHIFSDGPRSPEEAPHVEAVRRYAQTVRGFRSITLTTRSHNAGLSTSIIEGVTQIVRQYGRVIVVEDDIVTSPFFLAYMNDALTLYEREHDVISIHGYVYPHRALLPETFFMRGADCWGWATWQRGWSLFNPNAEELLAELNGKRLGGEFNFKYHRYTAMLKAQARGWIDSWAIRWYASAFLLGKLTLYPGTSLVRNIGVDGSGTHSTWTVGSLRAAIANAPIRVQPTPPMEDASARREFENFFLKMRILSVGLGSWNLLRHPRAAGGAVMRIAKRTLSSVDG